MAVTREGRAPRTALAAGVAGAVVLALAQFAPLASAATIEVTPGPNAINKAIDKAHNGDLLRIHDGTYRGAVIVDKRLTLRGVGGRPLLDARCNNRLATRITHAGVTLDHLKVVGAAENPSGPFPSGVDFEFVATGTVHDVIVRDTCGAEGAEYGINVFDSGPIEVSQNLATGGFSDAGIYIGGITDTGGSPLRVVRNASYGNHQGIIIENSGLDARIQVAHNSVHHNTIPGEAHPDTGIFINNSDRVRLRDNSVRNNGHFGVNISPTSDHNFLFDNTITGNAIDLNNEGSANCGSGNTIGTRSGNPLIPCP
ncbi:MAG TPA: right-handed parallel beta-helix repeat-containing protein [Solirubrobacterales bacterium]|nr:right-handed parallel beta-helix repeat-containing protein [Solirubrobacterales bacterium]